MSSSSTSFDIDNDVFWATAGFEMSSLHDMSGTATVPVLWSNLVHRDDIEVFSVIHPDLRRGPWIAGGACLRWMNGKTATEADIDVFCKSEDQARQLINDIKKYKRFEVVVETSNAVTIRHRSKNDRGYSWKIQVILVKYFNSLQEVIDNFDISVCQVGTAGFEWIVGEHTLLDIKNKNLRFVKGFRPDSLKRLAKYWTYGYRPVPGTLEAIQSTDSLTWRFDTDDAYSETFGI